MVARQAGRVDNDKSKDNFFLNYYSNIALRARAVQQQESLSCQKSSLNMCFLELDFFFTLG
jgi:hypothetical protein